MCKKITSHWMMIGTWQPLFSKKMAAAASFSYKVGGGGKDFATLLAAVKTWSGYWRIYDRYILLQNLQISLYSCIKKWNACSRFHLFLVLTHGPLHKNNSNSCYAIMKSVTNFYVKR